jgi:hypothetical protein
MKLLVFVSGVLSGSLTTLSFLFKIMHWPGATELVVLGLSICSIIFIPSVAKYLYDQKK